jgi:Zn-dependent peptidase ImmA (M78 family)
MSEITNSPIGLKKKFTNSTPKAFKSVRRTPHVCNLGFVICNFPEKPGLFWFRLVRAGIYLYKSRLKKSFGMSLGEKDGGPLIAVNVSSVTIERQIFTAAHELGHLILHKDSFRSEILEENDREEMEARV